MGQLKSTLTKRKPVTGNERDTPTNSRQPRDDDYSAHIDAYYAWLASHDPATCNYHTCRTRRAKS